MPQNHLRNTENARRQWGQGRVKPWRGSKPKTHIEIIQEKYDEASIGGKVEDMDTGKSRPMSREEINRLKDRYRPTKTFYGPYNRPTDMSNEQIVEESNRLHFDHPRQQELEQEMTKRTIRRVDPREIEGGSTGWWLGPLGM